MLAGIGTAAFFAPVAKVVMGAVRPEEAGQASGATNAIREIRGVLGIAVLAAVFASQRDYATPTSFVDGFAPALILGAATVASAPSRRCSAAAGAPLGRRQSWRSRRRSNRI